MRKNKGHSASAGALGGPAVYKSKQPGFAIHPVLRQKGLERSSNELQRSAGWVLGNQGAVDIDGQNFSSDLEKPGGNAPNIAWGTIEFQASNNGPTAQMVKGWPKWAKPGFLDELQPRLEGCRQRLLQAEYELRRAEKAGGLDIGESHPNEDPGDQAEALALDLQLGDGSAPAIDLGPDEFAAAGREDEMLLQQLASLEEQMDGVESKWQSVDTGHRKKKKRLEEGLQEAEERHLTVSTQHRKSVEDLEALRGQLGVSETSRRASMNSEGELKMRLAGLTAEVDRLEQELSYARKVAEEFRDKLVATEQEKDGLLAALNESQTAHDELHAAASANQVTEEEVERLRTRLQESVEANEALSTTHADYVDRMEEERRLLEEKLEEQQQKFEEERQIFADERKQQEQQLEQLRADAEQQLREAAEELDWERGAREAASRAVKAVIAHQLGKEEPEEAPQPASPKTLDSPKRLHAVMHTAASQTEPSWDEIMEERVASALAAHAVMVEPATATADAEAAAAAAAAATAAAAAEATAPAPAATEVAIARPDFRMAEVQTDALDQPTPPETRQAEWLAEWEKGQAESFHLAHVPPLLMVAGLQADKGLLPARYRVDMDLLEMVLQPLAPMGPPEHVPLASVVGIEHIEPHEDDLEGPTEALQLELAGAAGRSLTLLAGDEFGTEALLAALVHDRSGPGEMLPP
mmetsp:Transcript_52544/g.94285  ORF Transcript_52544/g.94285 Transcript_52544/m.94285 type:complete len:697 (-) Transcript_52544:62-2152(-)